MTCHVEIDLGAYVLHALETEEAEAVSEHLTTCQTCRDEERSLAATAGLMALLRPEDLKHLEDLEHLEDMHGGHGGRSGTWRSGWRPPPSRRAASAAVGAAALVGVALTVAVVTGVAGPDHPAAPRSSQAVVQAVDPATHVRAEVAMERRDSGTKLRLTLTGAYPHGRCSLVARARTGRTDTAATWVADAHGTAWVSGMTAFTTDQLTEFDVVTGTGRVLVRIPVSQATASDRS